LNNEDIKPRLGELQYKRNFLQTPANLGENVRRTNTQYSMHMKRNIEMKFVFLTALLFAVLILFNSVILYVQTQFQVGVVLACHRFL
jgi:hypothetical protein